MSIICLINKIMKNLIIIIFIFIHCSVSAAIVRNNTGTVTSHDSLSFLFYAVDSLGNPTTADSLFIVSTNPGGTIAYKDSMAISNSRIRSTTIRSKQFYSFSDQVSNLDGSGNQGVYSLTLLAYQSSQSLLTPNNFTFQIISSEFSRQIASINDSVNIKGGIIDSTMIAASVWNAPQSNHTINSTFGKYLDSEISGLTSGSGAFSVKLVTIDSSTNQMIPGTNLTIRNLMQNSLIAIGNTNSNGEASFNLDADSFTVIPILHGYIFEPFDTLVITGSTTDTLLAHKFNPGTPASPALCRMYGWVFNIDGTVANSTVITASIPAVNVTYLNSVISTQEITTVTDSAGYFYLDLIPSNLLTPVDSKYEITVSRKNGSIMRTRILIPELGSWMFQPQ